MASKDGMRLCVSQAHRQRVVKHVVGIVFFLHLLQERIELSIAPKELRPVGIARHVFIGIADVIALLCDH